MEVSSFLSSQGKGSSSDLPFDIPYPVIDSDKTE